MKQTTTFLFLGFSILLSAQPSLIQLEEFIKNRQFGKCYFFQPLDSTVTKTVFLEIEPHKWEKQSIKTADLIKEQGLAEELQSNSSFINIMVSPPTLKIVKRKGTLGSICPGVRTATAFSNHNALFLCVVEVPARYATFEKISIIQDGRPVNIVKKEKIITRQLVREGSINILSAEEASNVEHDAIYEIHAGEWTNYREYLTNCGGCSTYNKIKQINQALANLGYDVKVDYILNSDTRKALIDFQQKNGLPEGRLDIETLKALGVHK